MQCRNVKNWDSMKNEYSQPLVSRNYKAGDDACASKLYRGSHLVEGKLTEGKAPAVRSVITSRDSFSKIPLLHPVNASSRTASCKPVRLPLSPVLSSYKTVPRAASKIPVVTGKQRLTPVSNRSSKASHEKGLSAAARRQKYHLSRYPAVEASKPDCQRPVVIQNPVSPIKSIPYQRFLPSLFATKNTVATHSEDISSQRRHKVKTEFHCKSPCFETAVSPVHESHKETLPLTSVNSEISSSKCGSFPKTVDSQVVKKKKGLLGEFTHFPAICNVLPLKPVRHIILNTVPVLPRISKSTPAAPPPSVSSSIEQEELTKGKKMQNLEGSAMDSEKSCSSLPTHSDVPTFRNTEPGHSFHTVSIVVEPADVEVNENKYGQSSESTSPSSEIVKTLMDLAQLRKEAFARLLEEHAEIVQKIKKAETGQL